LASCTLLHGIHASFVTGGVERNSCVGDDALGVLQVQVVEEVEEGELTESLESRTVKQLAVIGRIAPEKSRFLYPSHMAPPFDSCRWTYLKRWLDRYDQELAIGTMVNFPPYAFLVRELETVRRMQWDINDDGELRPRLAAQLCGSMKALSSSFSRDGNEKYWAVYEYLDNFYREYGLPRDGYVFVEEDHHDVHLSMRGISCIPAIGRSKEEFEHILEIGYIEFLLKLVLQRCDVVAFRMPETAEGRVAEGYGSYRVKATSHSGLSLAEKMGYASKKVVTVLVPREDLVNSFLTFLSIRTSLVYEWCIFEDIPEWMYDILL
jgi:hypothetical protein